MKFLLVVLALTLPCTTFATNGFEPFIGSYSGTSNVTGKKCYVIVTDLEVDPNVRDHLPGIRLYLNNDLMDFLEYGYEPADTLLQDLHMALQSESEVILRYYQSSSGRRGYLKINKGVLTEMYVESNFLGIDARTNQCSNLKRN